MGGHITDVCCDVLWQPVAPTAALMQNSLRKLKLCFAIHADGDKLLNTFLLATQVAASVKIKYLNWVESCCLQSGPDFNAPNGLIQSTFSL